MKLIAEFDEFLTNTVNLNSTRFTQLEDSIKALQAVVRNSNWEPTLLGFAAQGSWAHKTIIKPVAGAPFDADLIAFIEPVDDWEAKDYLNTLYNVFNDLALYKDKVRRYSHCVTIEYAGERKVDIAPCIERGVFFTTYEVCNRVSNSFEASAPKAYTDWLTERNTITGKNTFRKVTRLIKYLRDIKTTFTCPSFLLTTLLGLQVSDWDRNSTLFPDVPTALKELVGRLDNWLTLRPTLPEVCNPVLASEIQSSAWDETKYQNFRARIQTYRTWIDDAYNETDREESIGKWQRVFGEDFATQSATDKAANVSTDALAQVAHLPAALGAKDLVTLVKRFGERALPTGFAKLPHMHRPIWKKANTSLTVKVKATLHTAKSGGQWLHTFNSLDIAEREHWIRFEAITSVGMPLPSTYQIQWRVTNTDKDAWQNKQLRGDFYKSDEHGVRWERVSFHGVHMVEAFVIQKSDKTLIGQSLPFYVTID